MSRFCILLGGLVTVTPRLRQQVSGCRSIAADGGIAHAQPLGLAVEPWFGDFDLSSRELESRYRHPSATPFPPPRTERTATSRRKRRLPAAPLPGAGGRPRWSDRPCLCPPHPGAQVVTLGVRNDADQRHQEAHPLLPGKLALSLPAGSRISLLPLSDLEGLSCAEPVGRWTTSMWSLAAPLPSPTPSSARSRSVSNSGYGIVIAYPRQAG